MTDWPIFALGAVVMSIVGMAALAVGRLEVRVIESHKAPRDRSENL